MPLDLSPLWISIHTALVATFLAVVIGIMVAQIMFQYQGKEKGLIDGVLTLPLVLPPIVVGFLLLLIFGRNSPIGQLLQQWGTSIIFSWSATVIASTVVAFPLMYKSTLGAFEQVDRDLINCARTLGASENRIFWQLVFPLSWRGIISGIILTFARALGEFGATLMLAGNIPGKTQTMPLAIYFAAEAGKMNEALIWVIILIAIALGVITSLNYWSYSDGLFDRLIDSLGASVISRWASIIGRRFVYSQPISSAPSVANICDCQELVVEINQNLTSDPAPPTGARERASLTSFSLTNNFSAGEQPLGILGASGSGKSMTLRCIAGLETPDTGTIVLNGRSLFDSQRKINVPCRQRRIGFVFQNYALFPNMKVARNIGFGLQHLSKSARREQVQKYIDLMQLQGLEKRYPHQLSGGQQQRVALARALAIEPEAILLDEPLAALDNYLRHQIEQLLTDVFTNYPGVVLFVTHKLEEAYRLCQDLVILDRGQVIGFGDKKDIFQQPPNFKVAQLTECKNFSQLQIIDQHTVKAIDWHCTLQILPRQASLGIESWAYVGVRAHHLQFVNQAEINQGVNTFPCWLVRASETPHRMTLYLKLHSPGDNESDYHLQGEIFQEKWHVLKDRAFPWYVYLDPSKLILLTH
ncbi:MAG: molybdate ABC transporter permease subunit [Cyanobacteria bacterium P01_G01_bin.39]